jgi:hypothetical protein
MTLEFGILENAVEFFEKLRANKEGKIFAGEMNVRVLCDRAALGGQITDRQVWVNDDAHEGYRLPASSIN